MDVIPVTCREGPSTPEISGPVHETQGERMRAGLVILTPERLTPSNPEHVALARCVQNLLEERGLLRWVVQPPPIRQA
jgi:hypothetical protein